MSEKHDFVIIPVVGDSDRFNIARRRFLRELTDTYSARTGGLCVVLAQRGWGKSLLLTGTRWHAPLMVRQRDNNSCRSA